MSNWHGCYDNGWNGLIVPDAFAHPAKMAHGLLRRILSHCLREGWLKPGDTVVDPFGGIGTGGIMAAYEGLRWIGCELEPRFVDLARQNFEMHRRRWEALKAPLPVIVQGDSRKLSEVLGACECVSAVIGSPPFLEAQRGGGIAANNGTNGNVKTGTNCGYQNQGTTDGNLSGLPPGSVDAALQADCVSFSERINIMQSTESLEVDCHEHSADVRQRNDAAPNSRQVANRRDDGQDAVGKNGRRRRSRKTVARSETANDNNAGEMGTKETRNPLADSDETIRPSEDISVLRGASGDNSEGAPNDGDSDSRKKLGRKQSSELQARQEQRQIPRHDNEGQVPEVRHDEGSGDSPQERRSFRQPAREPRSSLQLLPHERDEKEVVGGETSGPAIAKEQCSNRLEKQATLILSSPPYEGSFSGGTMDDAETVREKMRQKGYSETSIRKVTDGSHTAGLGYGIESGQLGNTTGDTFWAAARQIVLECHKILRPGGHAVWVVKNFVRNKQIVDFTGDWIRLCEACGFRLVCHHRAMLVKETTEHTLFDGKQTRRKERKSFFRRLAESKGSPRIDWESVLCFVKGADQ